MNDKLLRIYLNDHLAGSVAAVEVAERCRESNEGSALGAYLHEFLGEVREDQAVLRAVLERIGGRENPVKQAGAWLLEKVGRAKLNGALLEYSDLSRVVELELLLLGVRGKLGLWNALDALGDPPAGIGDVDLPALRERAEHQLNQLEAHRLDAVRRAFATSEAARPGH